MARKPLHVVAASPKPFGRQGIWDAIRALNAEHNGYFTVRDIADRTDIPAKTIRDYLDALYRANFVVISVGKPGNADAYLLVNDTGVQAPRLDKEGKPVTQGLARDHMWRTMKMLSAGGDFSARDLAIVARTDAVAVSETDARDYVGNLLKAGYLAITHKAGTRGGLARYRLLKNTGPCAPSVQRQKTVFDHNLQKIMWAEGVEP